MARDQKEYIFFIQHRLGDLDINHFNITILTANTIFDVLEILNKRTDLDLMIVEILEGDNDPVEIELLQKARAEQQAHLRIVIHTQEERIVRSQSGDLAKIIPVRDRFLKGYDDGHFPGTEDFLRSRIRDWLGAW